MRNEDFQFQFLFQDFTWLVVIFKPKMSSRGPSQILKSGTNPLVLSYSVENGHFKKYLEEKFQKIESPYFTFYSNSITKNTHFLINIIFSSHNSKFDCRINWVYAASPNDRLDEESWIYMNMKFHSIYIRHISHFLINKGVTKIKIFRGFFKSWSLF